MSEAVVPINLDRLEPAPLTDEIPEIRWVDPRSLKINAAYQRSVNKSGLRLIETIITKFDWSKYKLPNTVETPDGLEVTDGQHTAIACASHPDLNSIPVIVAKERSLALRASAFIDINRNRLSVTPPQMHHARVASGDGNAKAIHDICAALGIRILRTPRELKQYKERETVAVNVIESILKKRGAEFTARVLSISAHAKLAPISAGHLKALVEVLADEDFISQIDDDALALTIMKTRATIVSEAKIFAAERGVTEFKALASVWKRAALKDVAQTTPTSRRLTIVG